MGLLGENLRVEVNFALGVYDRDSGELLEYREVHNVCTNTGRTWISQLFGSSDYTQSPPTPHTTEKATYIGFGCGGVLQTSNNFAATQAELTTVTALEDPVPLSVNGTLRTYLKTVDSQSAGSVYFPGNYRTVFIVDVLESEISFAGNTTRTSAYGVGTSVPISEAGLYLNTALPTYNHVNPVPAGQADPAAANRMICYNTFEPVTITPNVVVRAEWELRV
jgi:hypothetical protein